MNPLNRAQRLELAASIVPIEAFNELVQPRLTSALRAKVKDVLVKNDISVAKRLRKIAEVLEIDETLATRIFGIKDDRGRLIGPSTITRIAHMVQI